MTFQTQKYQSSELDKKRWFVRYLLLAAVAIVLAFKTYLLLYSIIDFTLGIYSFFSSFVLFNILIFAYLRYRDPFAKVKDAPLPKNPSSIFNSGPCQK